MARKYLQRRTALHATAASVLTVALSVLFMPTSIAQADTKFPGDADVSTPGVMVDTGDVEEPLDVETGEGTEEAEEPSFPSDLEEGSGENEVGDNGDPGDAEADGEPLPEGYPDAVADVEVEGLAAALPVLPAAGNHRLAGKDRYATAALVSAQVYPKGADIVILATGAAFADAISVAPLASKLKAPVLLTQRNALPQATQQELTRLKPDQVIVIGGKGAISDKVANAAGKGADSLIRLGGATRYATSLAISQFGWEEGATSAFIATGTNFADALTAGPAAGKADAPVLLVTKKITNDTAAVRTELRRLGVQRVYVTGGTGVVSAAVLKSVAEGIASTRYGGVDRYETAELVLRAHFSAPVGAVYWASGHNFPDAVSAAGAAGALGVPLAVSRQGCVPLGVNTTVKNLQPQSQVVLGGTKALSQDVANNYSCFVVAPTPTISGKASVGSTLTGKPGTWSPTGRPRDFG